MPVITTAALLDAIKLDYEEHGAAFIYDNSTGCHYRTPEFDEDFDLRRTFGAAGCWVGRILDRLDVLPAVLYPSAFYGVSQSDERSQYIEGNTATQALSALDVHFEDDSEDGSAVAFGILVGQQQQDQGFPLDKVVSDFAATAHISPDALGFTI